MLCLQAHIDINTGETYNLHIILGEKGDEALKRKGKEKERKKKENEIPRQNLSRLGSSFSLKGELSGDEDLVIDGRFQGEIDLTNHNLVVEKQGRVEADIRAKDIIIHGELKGNIHASGKVFISRDAQMTGDIYATRISIMDGAQFKGSVKMNSSNKKSAALINAKP